MLLSSNPLNIATGQVQVGVRALAGRETLAARGSLWPEEQMQGRLDRLAVQRWRPTGNATTIIAEGAAALTQTGTATTRNVAATSFATRARRVGAVSAATAAALAGLHLTVAPSTIGDGAGLGGFYYTCRFVPSDAAAVSGARMFAGMTSSIAAPTNVEPSTLTNCIGVAGLSTSANLAIVFGGSTAQSAIDLGSNFPSNGLSTDIYELILFAAPGSTNVGYRVERNPGGPGNNFVASGTLTNTTPGTTLPAATTFLAPRLWRSNNATALAVAIDLLSLSLETVV